MDKEYIIECLEESDFLNIDDLKYIKRKIDELIIERA